MVKPELGTKRQCQECEARFYDLGKTPMMCPECGSEFKVVVAARPAPKPEPKPATPPPKHDRRKRASDDEDSDTDLDVDDDLDDDDDDDDDLETVIDNGKSE